MKQQFSVKRQGGSQVRQLWGVTPRQLAQSCGMSRRDAASKYPESAQRMAKDDVVICAMALSVMDRKFHQELRLGDNPG